MGKIIDLFYKEIIPEASKGKVNAYFSYATLFNVKINDKFIIKTNTNKLIPVIEINNKELFDALLEKYVRIAYKFYLGEYEALIRREEDEHFVKNYVKSIITLLWSNATSYDYQNPIEFLKKRISFFDEYSYPEVEKGTSLGNLKVMVIKDKIALETPYALQISIDNNILPQVEFGISDNIGYIYAIQNFAKDERDKKLNRNLYKVNDGINYLDTSDNDDPESIKNVTPSTLLSACIAIAYLKKLSINKICIPPIMITRWNAKELVNEVKNKAVDKFNEEREKITNIQYNMTNKFLRTFRRLEYHFSNINIVAEPFIDDTNMIINVDDNIECNNSLLKEIYELVIEDTYKR